MSRGVDALICLDCGDAIRCALGQRPLSRIAFPALIDITPSLRFLNPKISGVGRPRRTAPWGVGDDPDGDHTPTGHEAGKPHGVPRRDDVGAAALGATPIQHFR